MHHPNDRDFDDHQMMHDDDMQRSDPGSRDFGEPPMRGGPPDRRGAGGLGGRGPPPVAAWEDERVGGGGETASASSFSVDFRDDRGPPRGGPPASRGGLPPRGGFDDRDQGDLGMDDPDDMPPPAVPEPRQAPRTRQRPAPPANDAWAGQSLGDALAPKKAPPSAASSTTGGGGNRSTGSAANSSAGDCSKTPKEICAWVRSLPESHVPEKTREQLASIVEDGDLHGSDFSRYVQTVPPEICAPKHAMKLKAAWNNVLKEAALSQVAQENFSAASKKPKATMLVI